jgi:hypothetical protein
VYPLEDYLRYALAALGYCPGRFAAEATREQRRMLETSGCPVREVVEHIIRRIDRTPVAARMASERETRAHPELVEA